MDRPFDLADRVGCVDHDVREHLHHPRWWQHELRQIGRIIALGVSVPVLLDLRRHDAKHAVDQARDVDELGGLVFVGPRVDAKVFDDLLDALELGIHLREPVEDVVRRR